MDSLLANKLRSSLTILGIVIGVAAVIAMLAVGEGAQQTITGSINEIGSNLLFVFPGNFTEDVSGGKPLTQGDAEAIMDPSQAPSVAQVAPVLSGSARLTYGSETSSTSIEGVTPEYQSVRNFTLSEGEFVNTDNILGRASVVVLGSQTAEKLFGHSDGVVGETIRTRELRVQVCWPDRGGAFGSQDNMALIPFTTAQSRLLRRSNNRVDTIYIQAVSAEAVSQAAEEVKEILRSRHRIGFATDDFTVYTQQDFVATASTITGVLTLFLGGIAAISLLVGGIGIMNIMLVSVTERTREIGLRKALGARKRDILIQFLTESSLLSLFGGLIGIGLGWLIAFVVGRVAAASNTPLEPAVGLNAILLATLFSTAVGLFFGLYPANRAASLQPVEALRYE